MPSIYIPGTTPHCLVSTEGNVNFLGTRNLVYCISNSTGWMAYLGNEQRVFCDPLHGLQQETTQWHAFGTRILCTFLTAKENIIANKSISRMCLNKLPSVHILCRLSP